MTQDSVMLPVSGLCPSSTALCETVSMRTCEKGSSVRYPSKTSIFLKSFSEEFLKKVFEQRQRDVIKAAQLLFTIAMKFILTMFTHTTLV